MDMAASPPVLLRPYLRRKPPVRLGSEVMQLAEEVLASLESHVTVQLTLGGDGETRTRETEALVELVARTSSKVTVNKLDFADHPDEINTGVSHGPIIEMKGKAPGTLKYYGYPERKEVRPFLEGILSASGRKSGLLPDIESYITRLDEEILIRIFTTPD